MYPVRLTPFSPPRLARFSPHHANVGPSPGTLKNEGIQDFKGCILRSVVKPFKAPNLIILIAPKI